MSVTVPENYRAWVWNAGDNPLDLQCISRETPVPEAGEVLVRNAVIGLNPVDWKVLGMTGWQPGKIPGCDGAGEVVALGQGVAEGWLGQRVCYHTHIPRHGSFAECTPVKVRALMRVPPSLGLDAAASVPCPALTAHLALAKLPAKAGTLLVSGAGGAVGHYLVQFAVRAGWNVTARCHPRHHATLSAFGAVCILHEEDPGTAVFDAAVDLKSPESAQTLFPALRANGHLVCVQGRVPGWGTNPFAECISLHEVALGALHAVGDEACWRDLMQTGETILAGIAAGLFVPETLYVRDFPDLAQYLYALKHRSFSGKPLIRVG